MRNYGNFTTTIWRDPDFTSLSQSLQQVYFMLGLQPNVSAAGTLALTTGRWARMAAGLTRTELEEQIVALGAHAGRHVVIDQDTEELLIRKFMKWDGGWYNEKRAPAVADAIRAISSVHIRDIAVEELERLIPSHALSARAQDALSVVLPDRQPDTTGLRVTLSDHKPLALNPNPEPGAVTAADAAPPRNSKRCPKHQDVDIPGNCGDCKDARETEERRALASLDAEVAAKKAKATAIKACSKCDDHGREIRNGIIVARTCACWASPAAANFGSGGLV